MVNYQVYVVEVNLSHKTVQYGKCYLNLTPIEGNEKVTQDQVERILKESTSNIVSIKDYVPPKCILPCEDCGIVHPGMSCCAAEEEFGKPCLL